MHGNGVFLSWVWDLASHAWRAGGCLADLRDALHGGGRVSREPLRRYDSLGGVAGNGKRAMKHRDGVLQCLYVAGSCSMCVPCELVSVLPVC